MRAIHILGRATELVGGDRANVHGDMLKVHNSIAALWNAYLSIRPEQPLTGHDVALMMSLLKIARMQNGTLNADDYVDGAGYIGIAGELSGGGGE